MFPVRPPRSFLVLGLVSLALLASACGEKAPAPEAAQSPAAPSAEARAAFQRARELFALEKPFEAIAEMEKAVAAAPEWAEARLGLGKLLVTYSDVRFSTATIHRGQLARAIDEFERACALAPHSADAAYWAGFALRKADRGPEAARWLEQALELDARNALALKEFGSLYAGEGDAPRALEFLTRARALLPNDDEVLFLLGMQLESEERLEEARDAYVAAARLNTGHPGPRSALVVLYRRLGDAQASEHMAREFERCREFGKRITAASQRFDENSRDPEACMGLAELYHEVGMHGPAIQWAERALRLDPEHAAAIELLRKLGKAATTDGEVPAPLGGLAPASELEGEPR